MNFGQAPTDQGGLGDLIPDKTLAWAIVTVRPHNMDLGTVLVPSKSSDGRFIDVELTICEGPYARRKVWDRIGLAGSKEKWVAQGFAAVRHILEVGREIVGFQPNDPKYTLGTVSQTNGDMVLMELDGLRCAIQIGVQKGTAEFPDDKNTVRAYLSPNPNSNTFKTFQKLVAGDTAPPAPLPSAASPAAAKPATPSWVKPAAVQQPTPPQPVANARPAWMGAAPPAQPATDPNKPPF